jgi:PucR family transcriptional regulator, purine catabolism regulatory protein
MYGIPVSELINNKNSHLGRTKLLAGEKGLHNLVTNVNVMEAPDIANWVRAGDLLLTSTYSIKDIEFMQEELIPQLAKREIAAIALKTNRFLMTLPGSMLEMADKFGIPLLELEYNVSFSYIITEVLEEILNNRARTITEVHEKVQLLTSTIVAGGSLATLIDTASEILNKPIALIDANQQILVSDGVMEDIIWPVEGQYKKLALADSGNPLLSELLYSSENPSQLEKIWIPIKKHQETIAYLICWNINVSLSSPIMMILQHVIQLISIYMKNQKSILDIEEKLKDGFLQKWISGEYISKQEIQINATSYGISLHECYSFCLIFLKEMHIPYNKYIRLHNRLLQQEIISFYRGDELIFLVPEDSQPSVKGSYDYLEQNIQSILNIKSFRMGISSPKDIEDIHAGSVEAKEALDISNVIHPEKRLCFFNELGIFRVIHLLYEKQDLTDSVLEIIHPILAYDKKNGTNLFNTLSCFYRNNCNIKSTANEMFCHFNTIIYRLERIENIIQMKVNESENMFRLQLAIRLYKYIQRLSDNNIFGIH